MRKRFRVIEPPIGLVTSFYTSSRKGCMKGKSKRKKVKECTLQSKIELKEFDFT